MLEDQAEFVTVFNLTGDLDEMLCIWGYDPGDPVEWGPGTGTAHLAYDAFAEFLLPVMANDYALVEVRMRRQVAAGTIEAIWQEVQGGAAGGSSTPQNTALLLNKSTLGVGRGKSGRCYLPGIPEGKVDNTGRIDQAWADTVSDQCTNLLAAFDDTDLPGLVVNRGLRVDPLDPPPREPTVMPSPLSFGIEAIQCDPLAATQRRRLRP